MKRTSKTSFSFTSRKEVVHLLHVIMYVSSEIPVLFDTFIRFSIIPVNLCNIKDSVPIFLVEIFFLFFFMQLYFTGSSFSSLVSSFSQRFSTGLLQVTTLAPFFLCARPYYLGEFSALSNAQHSSLVLENVIQAFRLTLFWNTFDHFWLNAYSTTTVTLVNLN